MITETMDLADQQTARESDHNGYLTIRDNPITRAGVFQYRGSQLPGGDPDRIYNVYRPLEELDNPETLASFQGLPIIDEHEMLGDRYERSPEERGVHGSILENIAVKGNDVLANLRIWSRTLKSLLDSGKKGLSLGYNCVFEKSSGIFDGITYDYKQRNIRGNHLALVNQGRSGTAVLDKHDVFDHFDLALDNGELGNMADDNEDKKDDNKPDTKDEGDKKEMTLSELAGIVAEIVPQLAKINEALGSLSPKEADEELDDVALDDAKGDTKEKPGDQKAEDEKKVAMDSAEIERIVNRTVSGMNKKMLTDVSKRDALVKDLSPIVGTFNHSAMDSAEVAKYGCEKLGLQAEKGEEAAVLRGYLAGKKSAGSNLGFAMDSQIKPEGKLANRINRDNAA